MWRIRGLRHGCFSIGNSANVEALAPLFQDRAQGTTWNITWRSVSSGRRAKQFLLQGVALALRWALLQLWGCSSVLGFTGTVWHLAVSSGFKGHCLSCPLSPPAPGNWFFPVLPPCMPRHLTGRPAAPCSLPMGSVKEWRMSQQVFPCCPRIFMHDRIEWF